MSTKIANIDSLISKIDEDLSWRKKELHYIKSQIPQTSSPKQSALIRSAIPLLYAHWEGFAKKSLEYYLSYVSSKCLKHSELKPQFIALSLSNIIGQMEAVNIVNKTKMIEGLFSNMDRKSKIPTKDIIQTKSNLNYNVFQEIIFTLGVPEEQFSHNKFFINDLVDCRNHIAHGNYLKIDYKNCIAMYADLISLLETLKTELINSATLDRYKS